MDLFGRQIFAVAACAAFVLGGIGSAAVADNAKDDNITFEDPFDPAPRESFVSKDRSIKPMLSIDSTAALQSAVAKYEYIARRGGWQPIPPGKTMAIGSRGDRVILLRDRLAITGDLKDVSQKPHKFDAALDKAVRNYQLRMGLQANGVVDKRTLAELNVPVTERLRTLKANIPRTVKFTGNIGQKYVVVNIPAAEIEAVEEDYVYSRHVAVVGKIDRQTPIISSKISQLNFNPYWTVPVSIVRKDLLPKLREDSDYLQRMNMRVHQGFGGPEVDPSTIDWSNVEEDTYVFRQDPGRINSMGTVKINFPNKHAVYLHDTPSKSLFAQATRLFSSGCVRVDKVHVLTEWLLRDNGDWPREAIDQVAVAGERVDVNLKRPVPLRIVYLTAWAKVDGTVSFRPDIYKLDGTSLAAAQNQQTQ